MELRYLDIIGKQGRDSVTGFEGTIVAATEWMNGCVRYSIQPNELNKDGKVIETDWFDSQQVIIEERKESILSRVRQIAEEAIPSGGPRNDPPEW